MAGISSKAANTIQNKEKTFQGQRFDDELGLNWIQFKWRNHDPQIGRFIEIDPLSDDYVYNSTYAFSENRVTSSVEIEGLEAKDLYNELGPIRDQRAKYGIPKSETKFEKFMDAALLTFAGVIGAAVAEIIPVIGTIVDVATTTAKSEEPSPATSEPKSAQLVKAEARAEKLSEKPRPGKDFTKAGKEAVKDVNKAKNENQMQCENCGRQVQKAKQHKEGETPPSNEAHVDHIDPKSKGGSGTPNNGQVLCRGCNLEKSDKQLNSPAMKLW